MIAINSLLALASSGLERNCSFQDCPGTHWAQEEVLKPVLYKAQPSRVKMASLSVFATLTLWSGCRPPSVSLAASRRHSRSTSALSTADPHGQSGDLHDQIPQLAKPLSVSSHFFKYYTQIMPASMLLWMCTVTWLQATFIVGFMFLAQYFIQYFCNWACKGKILFILFYVLDILFTLLHSWCLIFIFFLV